MRTLPNSQLQLLRDCSNVGNSLLLWVARLDDGTELKVTDPKEQQGDVEEEETKGEERRDGVDGSGQGASC